MLPLCFLMVIPLVAQSHSFLLYSPAALGVDTQRGGRDQCVVTENAAHVMQQMNGSGKRTGLLRYVLCPLRYLCIFLWWSVLGTLVCPFLPNPEVLHVTRLRIVSAYSLLHG